MMRASSLFLRSSPLLSSGGAATSVLTTARRMTSMNPTTAAAVVACCCYRAPSALLTSARYIATGPTATSNPGGGGTAGGVGKPKPDSRPHEEDVLRNERMRTAAAGGTDKTAEEAHAEAMTSHIAGYNPWEVLGLKAGASNQTIRLRYHELMKEVHPDMATNGTGGDIPRLNQINKAYELITKSPTLDKRYRNLVSDTQHFYYRFLPEWMARNVDEMPRYWSWTKWRTPTGFQIFLVCFAFYACGRLFAAFPKLTTVFVASVAFDILFHTMIAPATLSFLFLYSIMAYRSYDMAWLTSPRGFLRRELGY